MQPVPKVALQALRLERDLVIFDLETTGLDIRNERIVQLAAVQVHSREHHVSASFVGTCPRAVFMFGRDLGLHSVHQHTTVDTSTPRLKPAHHG
jgi:DNA polymerase III epsilon subunit-like protein